MVFSKSKKFFPDTLARGAFVAYFLGGIVPLAVLGAVVDRYALSPVSLQADGHSAVGLFGLVGSICLLSLSSFFMLRRLVLQNVAKSLFLANYDSLTGLANRALFADRLKQILAHAQDHAQRVAICYLDLDGFKQLNDTFGHSVGDQVLREVATRLKENLRINDAGAHVLRPLESTISRQGGDKFAFLIFEVSDSQVASSVVKRVLEALRKPFSLDGRDVTVTASVGVAVFPSDGNDAETLVRKADVAMYWAKSRGRNNYQFFAKSMNSMAQRKLDVERCLRRSLERYPFALHYQPIREIDTAKVIAVEALLRWEDPELGSVGPAEFVPVAEAAGLIAPLGEWVLRTACVQLKTWQNEGFRSLRMSVNVSGSQIRHPAWVSRVADILRETELTPACLELEINESTILHEDDCTRNALRELSDMGISLALTDFGTGRSSLSYLQNFPIDHLKIDRIFVEHLSSEAGRSLMKAIISMAHDRGIEVVAVGVETREQAEILRESGCDELQGFLLSPAVPHAQFVRFLEKEKRE
ncbi:MAG: EAL domain-containing protein [Myxococcota bacterium]